MQPEVPFLTTTVDKLKWFDQELTKFWKKNQTKQKFFPFSFFLTQKVKVTFKVTCNFVWPISVIWYYSIVLFLWRICDSIQRIIREISAIDSLMTSCFLDLKWHKKWFLRNKSHRHSALTETSLISKRLVKNGLNMSNLDILIDVIPRKPEVPLSGYHCAVKLKLYRCKNWQSY